MNKEPWPLEILVGGFNPFEKYARQIGSFPQVGVKKKMFESPPPRNKYHSLPDTGFAIIT